ncbi:hypothetical protein BGZ70_008467 [Mortierella alpina]|uniref:RNA helicase n=1 Tax=Mortierella alpina TaxID=64518 RepID=A0A9P6M5X7_MORAP|nr:hypothetical protein BGZ70_008467 [Mortierella alpina]
MLARTCTRAWPKEISRSTHHYSTQCRLSPALLPLRLTSTTRTLLSAKARVPAALLTLTASKHRSLHQNAFESLGIYAPLATNLKSAMTIQEPTALQRQFIPPILEGKDVLIRDTTGSGKTFGILLSLLSKPRRRVGAKLQPGITSVIVVPNQELAFQLQSWARSLFPTADQQQLQEMIQVVVTPSLSLPTDDDGSVITTAFKKARHTARKGKNEPESTNSQSAGSTEAHAQVERLQKALPHVLVATPSRLWTLLQSGVLDLSGIETLVMDEVDHLIRLPKRFASQRQIYNRDLHPKPAELSVREIIRSAQAAGRNLEGGEDRIQIIAASATMNRPIRYWLESNGWIVKPEWVDTTKSVVLPTGIQHHCLVVGAQSIRNMKVVSDAVRWNEQATLEGKAKDGEVDWAAQDRAWQKEQMDKDSAWKKQQLTAPSAASGLDATEEEKFRDDDDRMLEGVATACMLDKVQSACVFFCSSFSLGDLATRLEFDFGLPVKQIQSAFEGEERQQVATAVGGQRKGIYLAHEANARGLDLPGLTHVYIVGMPSSPSSYLHMAGRTGRMGREGQVVTIIRDDGHLEDRARSLFNTLNVPIEPFRHVE